MTILNFFKKGLTPRRQQEDILNQYEEGLKEGYKFFIIEAPTGAGKTDIAGCIIKYEHDGYILTGTKNLQDQYKRMYKEFYTVKGKNNFECNLKAETVLIKRPYKCGSCAEYTRNVTWKRCFHKEPSEGPCQTNKDFRDSEKHNLCPYYASKSWYHGIPFESVTRGLVQQIGLESDKFREMKEKRYSGELMNLEHNDQFTDEEKNTIMHNFRACDYYDQLHKGLIAIHSVWNYTNFIIMSHMDRLTKRKVTIFDECHVIEDEIIKFTGYTVDFKKISKTLDHFGLDDIDYRIPNSRDINEHIPYLDKIYEMFDRISEFEGKDDLSKSIISDAKKQKEKIKRTLDFMKLEPANWIITELVLDRYYVKKAQYKPINLSRFCQFLYKNSEINVFMSATILSKRKYCDQIGIDPQLTKFISVPSDFPVENRPIYSEKVGHLNYKTLKLESVKQAITDKSDAIMSRYPNVKGIIHTTSYEQMDFIIDRTPKVNGRRLKFRIDDPEDELKTEQVLKQHEQDPNPTVLISPSLHTGIDLKDDLSRFQIIVKVPWPSRGDLWIEAKRQADPEWYVYKTALKLIQAYGRSVRTNTDYADTYILDSGFKPFVFDPRNKPLFPRWFIDAIK